MRLEREMKDFKDEMKKLSKEWYKKWGELANKMGAVVEDMVIPNIGGLAKRYFGCEDFDFFARAVKRVNSKDRSKSKEFDVIAMWDNKVIVNETKSTPKIVYVNEFLEDLKEFYEYFPEYSGKKVVPIFASLYVPDNILSYLTKNKIYAMAIKDDTMDLLNFESIEA